MQHSPNIEVRKVRGKGRGVFATKAIKKGAVIERVPVLVVSNDEFTNGIKNTFLQKYCYIWTRTTVAVALGYGSIYNHSYTPNADYFQGKDVLTYRALRGIEAGEEITVNYNGFPDDQTAVNFNVVSD